MNMSGKKGGSRRSSETRFANKPRTLAGSVLRQRHPFKSLVYSLKQNNQYSL